MGNHECEEGNPLCVPSMLKVFDFSADNDHEPDSNGEYTSATLHAGPLPESFTVCSAIMVDAFTRDFASAAMFNLLGSDRDRWGSMTLNSQTNNREYDVRLGPVRFAKQIEVTPPL